MKVRSLENWKLVRCCDVYFRTAKRNATQTAKLLSKEWGTPVRPTDIYPIVNLARDKGFYRILAPLAEACAREIASRFGRAPETIQVVEARGPSAVDMVAERAAVHVLELIRELGKRKEKDRVRVGFVGGRTVMGVTRRLAEHLRCAPELPRLGLHAVCSGFDARAATTAPTSFFSFFDGIPADVETVGLFAPPVVDAKDYERVMSARGVVESFREAEKIDIVVTGLSATADDHGALKDLYDVSDESLAALEAANVVGDVSYSPYSNEGPVVLDSGPRAVTLFQIRDLVELAARRDKHVVLVASPCPAPGCGRLRADALLPLLAHRELKVWTSVLLDEETAQRVLALRTS